jgi:L-methionine (R)-S-oxide reductase
MTEHAKLDESSLTSLWLAQFIEAEGGVSGTVHKREGELLVLAAAYNIPPPVLKVVATIPKGKGMAGLAWERSEPVSTCNLQTDTTGDVRPGAKAVNAQAAVALPVGIVDGAPACVVGIAFVGEMVLTEDQLSHLARQAEGVLSLN